VAMQTEGRIGSKVEEVARDVQVITKI